MQILMNMIIICLGSVNVGARRALKSGRRYESGIALTIRELTKLIDFPFFNSSRKDSSMCCYMMSWEPAYQYSYLTIPSTSIPVFFYLFVDPHININISIPSCL